VLFLQNPDRMRHFLPLVLALGVLSLAGWLNAGPRLSRVGMLLSAVMFAQGVMLFVERSRTSPPLLRAVRAVVARPADEAAWVFCGESSRLFALEDPGRRTVVRRARELCAAVHELNTAPLVPGRVLVFSEVEGAGEAPDSRQVYCGNPLIYDVPRIDICLYFVLGDPDRGPVSLVRHDGGAVCGQVGSITPCD
jgi:hypothetical protein